MISVISAPILEAQPAEPDAAPAPPAPTVPVAQQGPSADATPGAIPAAAPSEPAQAQEEASPAPATATEEAPTPAAVQLREAEPTAQPTPEQPEPTPTQPEPAAGPLIELEPEADPAADAPPQAASDSPDMLRGLKDQRIATESTTIGGYAELHYTLSNLGAPGESDSDLDMHRVVLFVAHTFTPELRFYLEFEVEHAVVKEGRPGEVGVEQAALDYLLWGEKLGLRAGIVLVPMGIINQWHEPPIFHGVERPSVDKVIIPSTWREGGIGVFGEPAEGLRYELYLVGGLDASRFSAKDGIRGGRQGVAEAKADGLAATGRVEVEPVLGLIGGVSGYLGLAGPNAALFDAAGVALDLDVPVWGASADLRGHTHGLEARAVGALFGVGDTSILRSAHDAEGEALGIDVGSRLWGAYGEVAYDVLYELSTEHQLLPFVRVERYDTLAAVQGREETAQDEAFGITELVFGATYRPVPQVSFKADYISRSPDGPSDAVGRFDLGVGVMF